MSNELSQPGISCPQVTADAISFIDLFKNAEYPLAIDSYQRGFVWNDQKIAQLREDLVDFQRDRKEGTPDYYMGNILLHKDEEKKQLFVIDGQQRLSALCVLYHHHMGSLPHGCDFRYSPESARNLRNAAKKFATTNLDSCIFDHIHFTRITVFTVDLAFTFFDTQNNRGVPLHATDLLKAYHLRAIEGAGRESLQRQSAKRWENLQHGRQVFGHGEDFAPALFMRFLWRGRTWSGQNNLSFESHDTLILEFQTRTLPPQPGGDIIPLYRVHGNLLGSSLKLHESGDVQIEQKAITLKANSANLPFAIRQPISKGVGFFLYSDKYAALVQDILDDKHTSAEVRAFIHFYQEVIGVISVYLREAFLLACVLYVDQFGYDRLLEFALWLDYSTGSIRIEKASVKRESAKNYFAKNRVNLLDSIAGAFTPTQVIDTLTMDTEVDKIYAAESIETGKGVQGYYKKQILAYYGRDAASSLKDRKDWITKDFIQNRIERVTTCR